MKDKSLEAESDRHDEHPELLSMDIVEEPRSTDTADDEEPGRAPQAEMLEDASAADAATEQPDRKQIGTEGIDRSHGLNTAKSISRHQSSRRRRSISALKKKLEHANRTVRYQRIALICVLGVTLLSVLVAAGIRASANNTEREVEYQLNRKNIELAELRSTVEEQKASIDSFVAERLPGLTDLEFDQVFEVDHPYVRNITFANVRTNNSNEYEFRIVLENNSLAVATPKIDVILFDVLGLEIDRRKLRYRNDTNVIAIESLSRGDIRSYVDSFIVRSDAKPVYFLVR